MCRSRRAASSSSKDERGDGRACDGAQLVAPVRTSRRRRRRRRYPSRRGGRPGSRRPRSAGAAVEPEPPARGVVGPSLPLLLATSKSRPPRARTRPRRRSRRAGRSSPRASPRGSSGGRRRSVARGRAARPASASPTLTCGFVGMSASARPASSRPWARCACVRALLRCTRANAAMAATITRRDEARADDRPAGGAAAAGP